MIDKIKRFNFWQGTLPEAGYFRKDLVSRLLGSINNPLVKVIAGQRRCGKSYLLRMLIKHLLTEEKVNPRNILYLNMEMHELHEINESRELMDLIMEYRRELAPEGKTYLFLDEAQEVNGWEKTVNSISQDSAAPCEVFLTGSNAHLLSSELATYLTGRYLPFDVYPYSYGEYCDVTNQQRGAASLSAFLRQGGLPETFNLANEETVRNYLMTLRDSILLNDIVRRHGVRDVALLQRLFAFVSDSIGSLFSVNGVVRHLKGSGYKTNVETVANQLRYLSEAYLIHEADRYDIQGKRILTGERKYYLNDTAFRSFLSPLFDPGIGKYLENALFLHLKRKGYTVYTGRSGAAEVDLVAEKNNERIYCQAAYLLADESIVEREYRSLMAITDSYPKFVVSMDQMQLGNREGIRHVPAWEFIA
jgi:predicted AAA+ superfamily ATPase